MPKWLPNQRLTAETGTSTISASLAERRKTWTSWPRAKCQQETPRTTTDPTVRAANIVCPKAQSANVAESSDQTLVSTAWPFSTLEPTGCCIHEFATRMKYAE